MKSAESIESRASVTTKALLLGALLAQNATLNVAARRARVIAQIEEQNGECNFKTTTGVVTTELLKVGLSFVLLCVLEAGSVVRGCVQLFKETVENPHDCLRIVVPAACYTVSNNVVLAAANYLPGPILTLFGGLRILAVGFYSVAMLKRRLGLRRWVALVALTASVLVIELEHPKHEAPMENMTLGLVLAATACAVSGFAGVYFELVLKGSPTSLWVRNIHLALVSLPIAFVACAKDQRAILQCGFFSGYSSSAITYVGFKAGGGLLIAAVIKYADNILKNFATAASVVVVALISALYDDFVLTPSFFIGATGCIYATLSYSNALRSLPGCAYVPSFFGGAARASCTTTVTLDKNDEISCLRHFEYHVEIPPESDSVK
ncbi:MAG: solute carrier family 35 transporter [Bacteroidota bacterium]